MTSYQQQETSGGPPLEADQAGSTDAALSLIDSTRAVDSSSDHALLRRALLDVMLRWIVNSVLVTIALCVLILLLMQSRGAIPTTHDPARPSHSTAAAQPQPRFASEPSIGSGSEWTTNAAAASVNSNTKIAATTARIKSRLPRHSPRVPAVASSSALISPDYPESPATPQNPASRREGLRSAGEDGKYMWLFFLVILLTICACGQAIAMIVNYCSRRQSLSRPRPHAIRIATPSPPPGELLTMESQPLQESSVARSEGQSEEEFHASVMAQGEQHAEPATDPTGGR